MIKMLILLALAALIVVVIAKIIESRMLRGTTYGGIPVQQLEQLAAQTQELVRRSIETRFAQNIKDIKILELGAFGANIVEASLAQKEEPLPEAESESEEKPTVEPGDDVVLSLRWRNTGEKTIRQAIFAVAFLSPTGEVLCPDALEKEPWVQQFGVAASASFTGHFAKGQGRQQKDMKNAFLLYHAPVDDAVILGVRLIYEDGTTFEQSVNA